MSQIDERTNIDEGPNVGGRRTGIDMESASNGGNAATAVAEKTAAGGEAGAAGIQTQTQTQTQTPRDVRLLRLIFATQGVTAYEDQVPLQLMDFAYRYTSEVLQDAMVYNDYAHPTQSNAGNMGGGPIGGSVLAGGSNAGPGGASTGAGGANNSGGDGGDGSGSNNQMLTNEDIRLAIAARTSYQFKPIPPKKMLMELAAERNEKPLPAVMPMWGLRLPPEKYCLTAKDWSEEDAAAPPEKRRRT